MLEKLELDSIFLCSASYLELWFNLLHINVYPLLRFLSFFTETKKELRALLPTIWCKYTVTQKHTLSVNTIRFPSRFVYVPKQQTLALMSKKQRR